MSEAQAVVGLDRLPWLNDEVKPAPKPRSRSSGGGDWRALAGWIVAAALLLASGGYWLGTHSREGEQASYPAESRPSATVPLPEPRPATSGSTQPSVALPATPDVRHAPVPEVRIVRPEPLRRVVRPRAEPAPESKTESAPEAETQAAQPPAQATPAPQRAAPVVQAPPQPLRLWPSWQSRGAYGRLVQIGAFGSRQQAKLGWRYMVDAYPALTRLPAVVVETRNSRRRPFYRFQIGTTSQAHSEILCQRMQQIRFSCAVVGLPWKPRGVER
jgi:hypothetical protein